MLLQVPASLAPACSCGYEGVRGISWLPSQAALPCDAVGLAGCHCENTSTPARSSGTETVATVLQRLLVEVTPSEASWPHALCLTVPCACSTRYVVRFQCIWRAAMGRRVAERLRRRRNNMMAIRMQRMARGFMGRRFAREVKWTYLIWLREAQLRGAVHIHRMGRGFLARRMWRPTLLRRLLERQSATLIQKVYRGHRARVFVKFMCAQRIQRLTRAHQARELVRRIKQGMEDREAERRRREEEFVQEQGDANVEETQARLSQKKNPSVKKEIKEEVKQVKAFRKRQKAARKQMTKAQQKVGRRVGYR